MLPSRRCGAGARCGRVESGRNFDALRDEITYLLGRAVATAVDANGVVAGSAYDWRTGMLVLGTKTQKFTNEFWIGSFVI